MVTKISDGTINVNGIDYVPKSSVITNHPAPSLKGLQLVLIRSYASGVHFGYIKKREDLLSGLKVELIKCRRIWAWYGAASLSQLAVDGVLESKKNDCKFSMEVESMEITQVIEIIPVTAKAAESINSVKVWEVK